MPRITIRLSDELYILLWRCARSEAPQASPEMTAIIRKALTQYLKRWQRQTRVRHRAAEKGR